MNVHVRCGDVDGSARLLARMQTAGMSISVVTYTIHLKGLCVEGHIDDAYALINQMLEPPSSVAPNLRTVNTLLRGCIRVSEIDRAIKLVERMQSEWNLRPDASTYE